MNKIYSLVLILLIVILAISSYFFIKEIAENKKENELFEELQEVVQEEEKTTAQNQITDNFKNETSNLSSKNVGNYNLESILKINTDIIGWIKIDGTNINYPVMQNGDFYLHRNVYKNYSSSGTPYLAEHCNLKTSDNLIIYGHHMKNSTMFSNLDNYKNYNYYKNHKYIKFYTLEDNKTTENDYEIVFAFKTIFQSMNINGIILLVLGGIVYTIGAIIYGIGKKVKYMHSLWHFFVLAGSILHFFCIYLYVI